MNSTQLINKIELKDSYACALMDYYINKGDTEGLQQYTDEVCMEWARDFILQYNKELSDKQIRTEVFKYIASIGANKKHSGKRFSEQLYKQLRELSNNQQQGLSK